MSTTTTATAGIRFARAEQHGVLLGLSGAQLGFVAIALVVAGTAVYLAGASGLGLAAAVWGPLLVVGTARIGGRPLTAWLPLLADWQARRVTGRTATVQSTRSPSLVDSLRLPGIAGPLAIATTPSGTAVVHDRRAGTLTAVARVSSAGFLLADVAVQDHRVGAWGRVLGSLSQADDVVRLQVLHRSLPAPGASSSLMGLGEGFAARVLSELLAQTPADQRETLVAVSLRAGRSRRGRPDPAHLAQVDESLMTLARALAGADLVVAAWLDAAEVRRAVRASYDPSPAALAPSLVPVASQAGPMAAREFWDRLECDGAVHAVYWVAEWPRSEVHPGFLQSLALAPGVRRSVSLTVEPLTAAASLRQIRRAKAEHIADSAQRAKLGQVEDESVRAEQADLARREAELVAGHGDLRFTGLLTVTAATVEELTAAGSALRSAAAQAMCEVRRLDGQHGLAHAAGALPLARRLL
ncbi:PrgI family protein [Actinotalea sp. K2]|uniref:PrgI family protein n=1 Tax=Actinotalea sp. K2 TaxID=2939438 RepID=UPI002016C627|nr:PrgI family protein [Actinotalea sp. K2]MCL3862071.1 PrgI family protein [Actinotalea sp. K2]